MSAGTRGLGGGAQFLSLTSIYIYHRFPVKELNGPGAGSCTPKPSTPCYILSSRGPWKISSNTTKGRSAENEVSRNSFSR